jgi:hypothetical protein
LYNTRPTWLDLAHRELDAAVFAAYRWPASIRDAEILEALLALNLERESFAGSITPPGDGPEDCSEDVESV